MKVHNISLFISDIHLSESRSDLTTAFFHFLETTASTADHLYILGDLFDVWAGDDIATELTQAVAQHLKALANRGVKLYFQQGNRDFVIGAGYAAQCGMTLLPEYYHLPEDPTVIVLHGDQLCTLDQRYQRYRKIIRNPIVLFLLRRLSKKRRLSLVNKIRSTSKNRTYFTNDPKLDIPEAAVLAFCAKHSGLTLIHGHTHRPDVHHYGPITRWVLSDWDKTADYLAWTADNTLVRHHFKLGVTDAE